jgi:hypothetical protein
MDVQTADIEKDKIGHTAQTDRDKINGQTEGWRGKQMDK